ncbi:MAG: SusC/RagA family TonB-linked outer membrane protein [Candidatus Cryptobacteroides sp.]
MFKKIFTIVLGIIIFLPALAQTRLTVSGRVTDSGTGEPVPFAALQIKGTTEGTSADIDGYYSISVPEEGTIIFSSIGYLEKELTMDGMTTYDIALEPDTHTIDETIVIAYGTATKSSFTGSASVIDEEKLANRLVSNVTGALSGAVSGVQTLSSNGQPGTSSTVRIRGIGSMYAGNGPLYVVDGIPYEGDISAINTSDIESMTVLKDAAASALYGARGANGVILITTRKGKGNTIVNFDARVGVNSRMIKNYDVLTSPKTYTELAYKALYNSYFYNAGYTESESRTMAVEALPGALGYNIYTVPKGQLLIGSNGLLNPEASLGYSDGQYFYTPDDWSKGTFSNNIRQEYNFSLSGSSEKFRYYLSAGYLDDGGVIEGSGYNRTTLRLNVDYQAYKWLNLSAKIGFTASDMKSPTEQTSETSSGNAFGVANNIAPIYPLYVRGADGKILVDNNTGNKLYDYGDGRSSNFTRNFMSLSNPMGDLLYNTTRSLGDILDGKFSARFDICKGLTFNATVGLHIHNSRGRNISNKYYGQSASSGGSVSQDVSRTRVFDEQYLLNYKNTFGKHSIEAMVGFEGMELKSESSYILGYNLYKDNDFTAGNVIDKKNGSGSAGEYSTMGILSRLSYDWGGRYYFSASYRRDASSRFHPDNRWGNFWSLSGAWDIANENWMASTRKWIDLLKLKVSFGQQGNDDLNNYYPYMDQYSMTGADGVFSDGTLVYKGNKDITWETSNSFNTGIDFTLWNGRLDGTVEYFLRQTKDMLYYRPVAPSNGYTSFPMNIGSIRNAGVEIDLNYTPFVGKNFSWSINWNGTILRNRIMELNPELEGQMINGAYIYKEGDSMYQFYLPEYAGVDAENGLALYKALGDNGEYTTEDWSTAFDTNRKCTGDLLAKIYGGFGTTLTFYGFDISVQCSYQLGGRLYDSGYASLMHGGTTDNMGRNWHKDILKAWKGPGDMTDVPRLDLSDVYASAMSDRWLISSNYLALNNITLGYTIPAKWTSKAKISTLRIYFSADNVAVASARMGLDPRMSYAVGSTSSYTALRTLSGGVKLTF